MVNRGRSGGCLTCKQRRVKCDEARPKCRSCQRLRLGCGYTTKYAFVDQNHKYKLCTKNGKDQDTQPSLRLRLLAESDTAVPFFLGHYASMGRNMQSGGGFFEILIPVYYSQPQNSAFSLAISAVASKILSIWRHGPDNPQSSRGAYTQAVMSLRRAIQDRIERRKPATVLAVLMLQLCENIAAIYGLRSASRIHFDGAVSLLSLANSNHTNAVSAYIRKFIFHTEVSWAMRQNRPLQTTAYSWIGSNDMMATPSNPSSALDAIGVFVTELQANYTQAVTQTGPVPPSQQLLREWRADAKRIDDELLAWARSVPEYWQPLRLISGQDIDPSIPTYGSICEVYPSSQIASIWNLWRFQRIILVKISLNTILYLTQSDLTKDEMLAVNEDFVECKQVLQELVDSVCYSVPFYLGNRTKPLTIADFTDLAILLPSYHVLGSGNKKKRLYKHDPGTPTDEHRRHIISQGPWHIMSPLSRLLTFFFEDDGMSDFVRPGQHEWIREQFLRVTMLLHIPPEEPGESKEGSRLFKSSFQGSVDTRVENLAKRVRKGALFMSGP